MFNQLLADYKLHGSKVFNLALWAVCNYRYGNWALKLRLLPFRWIALKIYTLSHFILILTSRIELNREAKIGKDLHIDHLGNIHIHASSIIGDRCEIRHDVYIGPTMSYNYLTIENLSDSPKIGNDVFIGAGAKLLGNITIGDGAMIEANSLVISDVPGKATAIGVPAKILRSR